MAKGGQFERDICRLLSRWWTDGDRDDVFWRSSGSGARATTRAKHGLKTAGSSGDVTIIDPIGAPLLDVFTIELKRGYSSHTIHSLIDHSWKEKEQMWSKWIRQATEAQANASSMSWMIISRRDSRESLITLPESTQRILTSGWHVFPSMLFGVADDSRRFFTMRLEDWLEQITPSQIKAFQQ